MPKAEEIERIPVKEAYEKVNAKKALLICAYEDALDCAILRLEGSISIQEFRKKRSTLPLDTELIFYCA
ncbi:ArsR family transcriptional regulator [bacterium]|nr:MAG: ArsR family transcriptional regulator [bacterium]